MVTARQLAAAQATSAQFLTGRVRIERSDPSATQFVAGKLVDAAATLVWEGPASISDTKDPTGRIWGTEAVQEATWQVRANLDAQQVRPGDKVTVIDSGDYPAPDRALWVRAVKGRQVAVLARLLVTATRPDADG